MPNEFLILPRVKKKSGVGMRRGFSLLELAITLGMVALAMGFGMKFVQTGGGSDSDCYAATRTKLFDIRGAVEKFARAHDRLPAPAARNVGPEDATYGRESKNSGVTYADGVSFGALPFQALGLPVTFAGDCWGNKFTYVVTTSLTFAGSLSNATPGNIKLARGLNANEVASGSSAYSVISHGADGVGAAKLSQNDMGWCAGNTSLEGVNCLATSAKVVDTTFNNGKDAGANYFDDIVVAAAKPKILATTPPTGPDCTTTVAKWSGFGYKNWCESVHTKFGLETACFLIPNSVPVECKASIEDLTNGQSKTYTSEENAGSIAVTCNNGTLTFNTSTCTTSGEEGSETDPVGYDLYSE